MTATREAVVPWDVEWAHEQAIKASEWLAKNYPECSGAEGLREHEKASDEAAATRRAAKRTWRPLETIAGPAGRKSFGYVEGRHEP